MKNIIATPINEALAKDGKVELVDIHYDLDKLEITISLNNQENDKKIIFEEVCGFRALDEGDLFSWWKETNLTKGWCFEVSEGGWFDFERQRKDFVSGSTNSYREFLVIGVDLCVSVITNEEPTIHEL